MVNAVFVLSATVFLNVVEPTLAQDFFEVFSYMLLFVGLQSFNQFFLADFSEFLYYRFCDLTSYEQELADGGYVGHSSVEACGFKIY